MLPDQPGSGALPGDPGGRRGLQGCWARSDGKWGAEQGAGWGSCYTQPVKEGLQGPP